MADFVTTIGAGVTAAIGYIGSVLTAIFSDSGALAAILPAIGLSVGVFLVGWGIGQVKSLIKGY